MVLFRDASLPFKESMENVKEFNARVELDSFVCDTYGSGKVYIKDRKYYDPKSKWNIFAVFVGNRLVGFTNGNF